MTKKDKKNYFSLHLPDEVCFELDGELKGDL